MEYNNKKCTNAESYDEKVYLPEGDEAALKAAA